MLALALALGGPACAGPAAPPTAPAPTPAPSRDSADEPAIELVESAPIETTLDHPEIPNADAVWLSMIERANKSLDFAEFYVSSEANSRLEPILAAIEAAADRGARVRFLVDETFYSKYPDTLVRLGAHKGISVRRLDMNGRTGGVLHAKYFLVDGREAYLGSQNFDWRSLTHIQEIGVRASAPEVVRPLGQVFEADWALAGEGAKAPLPSASPPPPSAEPPAPALEFVASPKGLLPDESRWDLPRLIAWIDGAKRAIDIQLLTYKTTSRDGSPFSDLDDALRRAAGRGVRVRLLVSDWSKKKGTIEAIQSLARVPGVEAAIITIPPWSGGFVPFARVAHAKYMVVDGARAWVGTSNWEGDYFTKSRNVGVLARDARLTGQLERVFEDGFGGPYAAKVDPDAIYEAPKVQ